MTTENTATEALLTIENIQKLYGEGGRAAELVALRDVSFTVPEGQFCAIVGPSGCGKSTLLNIIAGIDFPSSGLASLSGSRILGPDPRLGVMFQQYHLFPWMTVRGNIEFGPRSRGLPRAKVGDLSKRQIARVGLSGFEERYPHELSGGMQQRCALARMLANDPVVLLMDEPLAAVDAQTRSILQEELLEIWGESRPASERKTVLFVTHAIDEAVFLADRILVMGRRPGRIIADIPCTLKRPRREARRTRDFVELTESIWDLLHDQAADATRQ
ncbi:MAG: ABC transporter ATP-binding protein [Rhizobiaceae bacterium]|nr:ABC transporter ATP-binding protein [Rhizobiaceae bacterium]